MSNQLALITGASSGIGRAFALHYAAAGYRLVLTGRRKEKLEAVASECYLAGGSEVDIVLAELTNPADVTVLEQRIRETPPDVLINNAGFGLEKTFLEDTVENQLAMLTVHDAVTVRLTHAALPAMLKNRRGDIIIVSSVAAWVPSPVGIMYSPTKVFLNAFAESLHMRVRSSGVRVQALCPGFTNTDFHEKIGLPDSEKKHRFLMPWMSADFVVRKSLRALEKGKVIYIPGLRYKFLCWLAGYIPRRLYYRLLTKPYR
jgi:uncharacterized protein